MLRYPAVIHEDPDGLRIEFPDFGGSGTKGDSMEELLGMAEDVLSAVLTVCYDESPPIPEPSADFQQALSSMNPGGTVRETGRPAPWASMDGEWRGQKR
ncbi:MAG: type II toxin-antitoxin system HicB family antitoxin [Candidatus Eremiobacteraeota bacterium]|nr:type II toxin-antitoxin system HicB family antitoxin [Candidatus Eremiobacteraeota bacterium]